MESYEDFLATKRLVVPSVGREVSDAEVHPSLFDFQRQLVRWAVRKGRCALFATTGMGKTRMQLEWARLTGQRTLILAPLAVTRQTVREAEQMGLSVTYARRQEEAPAEGMTITNYEMLDRFRAGEFAAVVLDESSILKSFSGATKKALIAAFRATPYRFCCTALPAPNDVVELCNHAEFLGVITRAEMLAAFFVNDMSGKEWRLKGHAREGFYRWLASWSMALMKPSDLGFSNRGYDLPPLSIEPVIVEGGYVPEDRLFALDLHGVTERAQVRRGTLESRVGAALDLVAAEPGERWILWYGLLDEGRALARHLGSRAIMVQGSQDSEEKEAALSAFVRGEVEILITHPSIAGLGLNMQHCARMVFVGLSDSYEQYFQCVRRCWRYGQQRPVIASIVLSEPESVIYENVRRKEAQAALLTAELIRHVAEFERQEISQATGGEDYRPAQRMRLPLWLECVSGRAG